MEKWTRVEAATVPDAVARHYASGNPEVMRSGPVRFYCAGRDRFVAAYGLTFVRPTDGEAVVATIEDEWTKTAAGWAVRPAAKA